MGKRREKEECIGFGDSNGLPWERKVWAWEGFP